MNTIEILRENFHHMTAELLYYKYYKSNRDQVKGIERKNRQLAVLKDRLKCYEQLRTIVKKHIAEHIDEDDICYFLADAARYYVMNHPK